MVNIIAGEDRAGVIQKDVTADRILAETRRMLQPEVNRAVVRKLEAVRDGWPSGAPGRVADMAMSLLASAAPGVCPSSRISGGRPRVAPGHRDEGLPAIAPVSATLRVAALLRRRRLHAAVQRHHGHAAVRGPGHDGRGVRETGPCDAGHHLLGGGVVVRLSRRLQLRPALPDGNISASGSSRDLRSSLCEKLQWLSLAFIHRHPTGTLLSRVTSDVTLVRVALTTSVASLARNSTSVAALTAVAFYMDWLLACVAFVAFPGTVLPVRRLTGRVRRATRRSQASTGTLTTIPPGKPSGQLHRQGLRHGTLRARPLQPGESGDSGVIP